MSDWREMRCVDDDTRESDYSGEPWPRKMLTAGEVYDVSEPDQHGLVLVMDDSGDTNLFHVSRFVDCEPEPAP